MILSKSREMDVKTDLKITSSNEKKENREIEFISSAKLFESEKEFFEMVLKRGEIEGWWHVKRWVAGGSRTKRGALGVDFIIQNQQNGVEIEIEFKKTLTLSFTLAQRKRLLLGNDIPKSVYRLCIIEPSVDPLYVNKVCYWSPKFFQVLPLDEVLWRNFSYTDNLVFQWGGLGKCIEQNRENTLFQLTSGDFGYRAARYKLIPLGEAYEWLYQKLVETIQNPLEESKKEYGRYGTIASFPDKIKEKLLDILNKSYRPLYSSDFFPVIKENFPEEISYDNSIRGTEGYISHQLKEMVDRGNGEMVIYSLEGYRLYSYGLKKNQPFYLFLKKVPSLLLDILKNAWEESGNRHFTVRHLSALTKLPEDGIREYLRIGRSDLIKKGLIIYHKSRAGAGHGATPAIIEITDKCIKYFTWIR